MSPELIGVGLALLTVGILGGWWMGYREADLLSAANKSALLQTIENLRDDLRLAKEERSTLLDQIVRLQRSVVGLPELTPPQVEKPEVVEPPEVVVKMCSLFPAQGAVMLKQAIAERKKGVPWEFIIASLRRQIEAAGGGEVLAQLEEE